MTGDYLLKRYAAYYKGWCQSFGEHEHPPDEESDVDWLLADHQVGFISPPKLTRALHREILLRPETPTLTLSPNSLRIGAFSYGLSGAAGESAVAAIRQLLETERTSHVFLTSHIMYGMGTRIFTLSDKKPVPIIYKQIGTLRIVLR